MVIITNDALFELKVTPPREENDLEASAGLENWNPKSSLLPAPRSPPSVLFGPGASKMLASGMPRVTRGPGGGPHGGGLQQAQRNFILQHSAVAAEVA